ncbi:glycosyl transferase group 1 [Vulcanisaeta moutnovskia 768-28]|uniref:Glycosyl transferase group 1 n=1 Tax=Vulcanisaeta moutnovskia (strain 768-28) TaxID=985053 RepID=F0QY58_VULM7|nr:glycosyltransferase [Vulcanisaeta moutnovskia]ADY01295.1 glycosyl transferase group 1 [Vulcanisaeta moutnovskia 768-28]
MSETTKKNVVSIMVIAWPCIHSGGAERWWYYVIRELGSNDSVKVTVVVPVSLRRGCFICPAGFTRYGVDVRYVSLGGLRNFIKSVTKLIGTIRSDGIDYIVAGYQTPVVVLLGLVLGLASGRGCSVMFHNSIGWLPYTNDVKPLDVKNKVLVRLYQVINRVCRFIYVSPSITYDHMRVGLMARNEHSLMGAAVEFTELPQYRSINERDIDVVHLASISRFKGIYDVVEVLRMLKEYRDKLNAVIIGRMPRELEGDVRGMIRKYGLEDYVRLLGFVDEIKKFELLSRSRVMIYPSYFDTFAISVLEALTVGTPVVAYSIPAISMNYRTDSVVKIKVGDKRSMAIAVNELLNDPARLEQLSREAIIFSRRYSWRKIALQFLQRIIKE